MMMMVVIVLVVGKKILFVLFMQLLNFIKTKS